MSFSIRDARKTAQSKHAETKNLRKNWDSGGSTLSEVTVKLYHGCQIFGQTLWHEQKIVQGKFLSPGENGGKTEGLEEGKQLNLTAKTKANSAAAGDASHEAQDAQGAGLSSPGILGHNALHHRRQTPASGEVHADKLNSHSAVRRNVAHLRRDAEFALRRVELHLHRRARNGRVHVHDEDAAERDVTHVACAAAAAALPGDDEIIRSQRARVAALLGEDRQLIFHFHLPTSLRSAPSRFGAGRKKLGMMNARFVYAISRLNMPYSLRRAGKSMPRN